MCPNFRVGLYIYNLALPLSNSSTSLYLLQKHLKHYFHSLLMSIDFPQPVLLFQSAGSEPLFKARLFPLSPPHLGSPLFIPTTYKQRRGTQK